jgi:hypothetical protein
MKRIFHIYGGGTVFHVRPHLAISAPAYGHTARQIERLVIDDMIARKSNRDIAHLYLTKMASSGSSLETNEDVWDSINRNIISDLLDDEDRDARHVIFMSVALCDWTAGVVAADGSVQPSGKDQLRLKTDLGKHDLRLTPADKLIGRIRKERKDIFLVGFKTTSGLAPQEQFRAGLRLLKGASCNLVLANDVHTRLNMIVTPEEAPYSATKDRGAALRELVEMTVARSALRFTRSTVVEGSPMDWRGSSVPASLRTVVDHCIERGAYKPFMGKTVGHFAFKMGDGKIATSIRRSNFNELDTTGLVVIEPKGDDEVIAYGAKPSVGGQSQRAIFRDHPGLDCIVHFHCPVRPGAEKELSVRSQRLFECGSHECGQNAAAGIRLVGGATLPLGAVMLDGHGPNIVFSRDIDPQVVIDFIEKHFDLERSTSEVHV